MRPDFERYAKQVLFAGIGEAGQERLSRSRVLLVGCGALGSVLAETLVRAGVGFVRLVDRDFVETSNLQRQVLFDEEDVARRLPKAVAAAEKLRRINSQTTVDPHVTDVDHENVLEFARGSDLILDGTDNFEVRFLLNDAALETGIPWVYAGVIGSHGQTMAVFPGRTACLRCLIETVPEPGTTETCDTAGVLGPAVQVIASLQATAALQILAGRADEVPPGLAIVDVWEGTLRRMGTKGLREQGTCPACGKGERLWLSGRAGARTTVLCGRNAVQVSPPQKGRVVLEELAGRWASSGPVSGNAYLVRLSLAGPPPIELTVFRDGRAIVQGTDDAGTARSVYARYVGS
jgi:adenylyltransferase/sulfurtransferase